MQSDCLVSRKHHVGDEGSALPDAKRRKQATRAPGDSEEVARLSQAPTDDEQLGSESDDATSGLQMFHPIAENIWHVARPAVDQNVLDVCSCALANHDCDPETASCVNVASCIECSLECAGGDICANQRFRRQSWARTDVMPVGEKGQGLVACDTIEKGQLIIEYVGEVIDLAMFKARKGMLKPGQHVYFLQYDTDRVIDAARYGNNSRFLNHSCDPNACIKKWTVDGINRIGIFADMKIVAGEEITISYNFEKGAAAYCSDDCYAFKCLCDSCHCSRVFRVNV